jgi:carboxymethylenebutenolidase
MGRAIGPGRARLGLLLGMVLAAWVGVAASAASGQSPTLSNLRLETTPVEACGRMTFRVDFSGAQAPVARLWVRLAREGREGESAAQGIGRGGAPAPSGTLNRDAEMGGPGARRLTVAVEDAKGARSTPLEIQFPVVEPARPLEEVTYQSDGLTIKAYLYRPAGPGPSPAIIVSHGSRRQEEMAAQNRYEWLAYRMARLGYLVLVSERRGYGGSEGEGVVGGLRGAASERSLRYGLSGEVKDVIAAADYLKRLPEVDSERIALVGKSLGGFVSLLAAAQRPDLRAVVSMAGGFGFGDRMMGPEMMFVERQLRGAAGKIEIPTMVMHAENDRIVPVQFSRLVAEDLQRRGVRAAAKIYPPPKIGGKEREGHTLFDGVEGMPIFWRDLTDFLAENLKPPAAPREGRPRVPAAAPAAAPSACRPAASSDSPAGPCPPGPS